MSRFQKIFLASLIVIGGFGVAKFLGQPVLPSQVFGPRGAEVPQSAAITPLQQAPAAAPQPAAMVRLIPDSTTSRAGQPVPSAVGDVQSSQFVSTPAPALATSEPNTLGPSSGSNFAPILSAPTNHAEPSRARLRYEAPRPLGVDPQSPASIRRLPAGVAESNDPCKVSGATATPKETTTAWPAPQLLLNAGYTQNPAPPAAMQASYIAPPNAPPESQLAPPPWPMPEQAADDSRTHIVVDGDSLEKLAGRYLSDPKRGREIFELNRETLSSPDLLPIGAELKLPDRLASSSWDRGAFQPNSAGASPIGKTTGDNMASGRPAASPQAIVPRAQLAPPMMVQ